jgi:hypothetical protein
MADEVCSVRTWTERCWGMNGNYSAGVLEGLVHFLPHMRKWLEETS